MMWVEDKFPEMSLEEIDCVSDRSQSLMARELDFTKFDAQSAEAIRLPGTLQMLRGMEYHHNNFMRNCKLMEDCWDEVVKLNDPTLIFSTPEHIRQEMAHEVTAYLNRLGQFYYFAISDAVSKRLKLRRKAIERKIPLISKIVFFRQKHTAHRSVDCPKEEDTELLQFIHQISIDEGGVLLSGVKPNIDSKGNEIVEDSSCRNVWRKRYRTYQIRQHQPGKSTGGADLIDFSPERDHAEIMHEAFCFLKIVIESTP
jgi:hypothetical protein